MEIVLSILVLAILISAAYAGVSAAPWLPTLKKDRDHLFEELTLSPGQTVVDLGSGDGSMLFAVARRFPETICIGYEISLLPLFAGLVRKVLGGKKYRNVHLKFGNLFKQSLKEFDVVFVFLLAKSYDRLIERFRQDLKEDATVIVEAWPLPNIEPTQKLKKDGHLALYFYSAKGIREVH
jgi:cyclopropane fatty-acyl-phospholipid synthase-like methyltransferase